MRHVLRLHPDGVCEGVGALEAEAARPAPGLLALRFVASGVTDALALPPPAPSLRTDGLWKSTCFEAFVRGPSENGYFEFNLSPSTEWAAYRFDGYRSGMAAADIPAPRIDVTRADGGFELVTVLDLSRTGLAAEGPWEIGLTAVIEDVGARFSYWALAHPPGRPDFHHADCFALGLAAVQRA